VRRWTDAANQQACKVIRQVHPDLQAADDDAKSLLEVLISASLGLLVREGRTRSTERPEEQRDDEQVEEISSRDIQDAVLEAIPGDLAKHARAEGIKAVTISMSSSKEQREPGP
jgi:hypothetical protein